MYTHVRLKGSFWFKLRNVLSPVFTPGYSQCQCCGGYWNVVRPHVTMYEFDVEPGSGRGFFALCKVCWIDLKRPAKRLSYYEEAYFAREDPIQEEWRKIEEAVMAGG
jgi:hypothetical protein